MDKSEGNSEALLGEDSQWVDSHTILFRSDVYKSRMAVLNACIGELSRNRNDIQKIEIFEDPPQAIINIGDKATPSAAKKSLWRRKAANNTLDGPFSLCLKLDVARPSGAQEPFQVNCKIKHRAS